MSEATRAETAQAATAEYCRSLCDLIGKQLRDINIESDSDDDDGAPNKRYKKWLLAVASSAVWHDRHPGFLSLSVGNNEEGPHSKIFLPSCPHCGSGLQPGYHGSIMQLKSIPKKKRRRRRRQPKHSISSRPKLGKDPLTTWKETVLTSQTKTVVGQCHNQILFRCGLCHGKTTYPGLLQRKSTISKYALNKERDKSTLTSSKGGKTNEATTTTSSMEENLDFVPLRDTATSSSAAAHTQSNDMKQQRKTHSTSLLDQRNPKKRKKKKPKTKSSQLMNFLSKLND